MYVAEAHGAGGLDRPGWASRGALILDVGSRSYLSFNDLCFKGTEEARADFALETVDFQFATWADYLPNIRHAARFARFVLIIYVGFLLADALKTEALGFPNQKFAIVDAVVPHPKVLSLVFEEQEGSALVGALAGLLAAHYGYPYAGDAGPGNPCLLTLLGRLPLRLQLGP